MVTLTQIFSTGWSSSGVSGVSAEFEMICTIIAQAPGHVLVF